MRLLLTILLSLAIGLDCFAGNPVTGTVVQTSDQSPIAGANVLLKNAEGKLLAYGVTDANGRFSIMPPSTSENLTIHVAIMGYRTYSAPLALDGNPLVISMEEGTFQLQEVTVKADRIRESGDTITYNVGSFAQKQDRSIGDVLKRMPGIDVANNGKIQYQGIDINKFYIEGNDLLGGKYGIATNGIAYDDIGAVEVMENHQPMQVLRGLSFSDQAAINLKMKNSAKATFLVHGTLGGGWSEQPQGALWQGDIFTMMVTGKYQMITTFKGNNTGLNLSDELLDFTSEKSDEELDGYIYLCPRRLPPTCNRTEATSTVRGWYLPATSSKQKTEGSSKPRLTITMTVFLHKEQARRPISWSPGTKLFLKTRTRCRTAMP